MIFSILGVIIVLGLLWGFLAFRKKSPPALSEKGKQIEQQLLRADLGASTAQTLLARTDDTQSLKQEVQRILTHNVSSGLESKGTPTVILFVGVNGVGKTTSIGKVAALLKKEGKKVLLGAGDTFRAAAGEQLSIWGERTDCPVVFKPGADPASVLFDAVTQGKQEGFDFVLCDTAGRLHTKDNLMEELKKVVRVVGKTLPGAPHEIFLVLDGTTGQNALSQAREFQEAAKPTGIILTKLDGTAKGGIIVSIRQELDIPVRFIGVGEQVDDLKPFNAQEFTEALFEN